MSEAALAEMPAMRIRSHRGPYEVRFNTGDVEQLWNDLPANAHFLIDARVAELYRDKIQPVLSTRSVLCLEATEANKSLNRFPAYVEHLVSNKVRRGDVLIAVGGGIIQDITCFLAATLLRGLDWHFYPTTLLAQADSCIGSKSSINSGDAKNILGTFTPPRSVTISTHFLDTLPERDIRSGIGEMLKVHGIDGPNSFDQIARDYLAILTDREVMLHYLRRSLEIKKGYIERDEFDQGPRLIFNYGHSFGHAIEAATNFAIPHGIAVTIGVDMANWISVGLGVGSEAHFGRMHPTLRANYRGFESTPIPLEPFMTALSKDKKNTGSGSVTLILPNKDAQISRASYASDAQFRSLCEEFLTHIRRTS